MSDHVHRSEAEAAPVSELPPKTDDGPIESENASLQEGTPSNVEAMPAVDETGEGHSSARPDDVPEKFWDVDAGTLRTETLLKSYLELERKLGTMVPMPSDDDPSSRHRLQRALGKPETADDYSIDAPHELITSDPTVNAKLHEAGLSSEQAQLVYDLAAEHLVPLIERTNQEASQQVERSRLAAHFGSDQKWQAIAPQIKTWADANLDSDVYESLGSSADGVIAIYHMMQAREPSVITEGAIPHAGIDEHQLSQMMRDPRYWRDRDPAFVAEVTAGYKRLFE